MFPIAVGCRAGEGTKAITSVGMVCNIKWGEVGHENE